MVVYFLIRGIRPEATDQSVARSLALIRFEQRADLFWEVRLQQLFIGWDFLMHIANLVYAWGHYPVMLAIAVWLAFKDPVRFRFIRNVLIAIGNSADPDLAPVAIKLLDDASALVRGAAVWALAQLVAGHEFAALCDKHLPRENDDAVREEWRLSR